MNSVCRFFGQAPEFKLGSSNVSVEREPEGLDKVKSGSQSNGFGLLEYKQSYLAFTSATRAPRDAADYRGERTRKKRDAVDGIVSLVRLVVNLRAGSTLASKALTARDHRSSKRLVG